MWVATLAATIASCGKPSPRVEVTDESFAPKLGETVASSPWFDGARVSLAGARGETLGMVVVHGDGDVVVAVPDANVLGFGVRTVRVRHASTALYGTGNRGAGDYPDELVPDAADPSYFQLAIPYAAAPGMHYGALIVDGQIYPLELRVARATLAPLAVGAWAEYDPRSLGSTMLVPTRDEAACVAMFRERGVMLAPAIPLAAWPMRRDLLGDAPFVPVRLDEPSEVPAWIAATQGTGKLPFAIPIDEPQNAKARGRVVELAKRVRAAGGGSGRFLFAVTDRARADYGDWIDRFVSLQPRPGDWSYNGKPPSAGSMVVDGAPPGTRTWGWLAWRHHIPLWYAWQAMYWQDRYNHRALPPRPLDAHADARSFDDGEDRGNLDGVLALPGCHPTLRLEALRRGLEDRALLELALRCDPSATAALAAQIVPTPFVDTGPITWPTEPSRWEAARRQLLELASCALR
ncbi:MAG TPA: hypothetical protein VH143_15205 [Kofleriaceae bacterium]|nr:hypothetical protein [Kofleriaceae bacterium]